MNHSLTDNLKSRDASESKKMHHKYKFFVGKDMFVYGEAPSSFKVNESLENKGLSNFPVELRL